MEGTIICDLGELPLMAGSYSISFWLCSNPQEQHHVEDALRFTVEEKDIWGNGILPPKSCSSSGGRRNLRLRQIERKRLVPRVKSLTRSHFLKRALP